MLTTKIGGRAVGRTQHTEISAPAVLHVADYGGPYSGNFLASLHALSAAVGASGGRQTLAFPARAAERPWFTDLRNGAVDVVLLPGERFAWSSIRPLFRLVRDRRITLIHSHFSRYDLPVWLAAMSARVAGQSVAIVWHEHGGTISPAPTSARRVKDLVKLRLLGRWAYHVSVSPALRDEYVQRGHPADKAFTVLNGIDLQRARSPRRTRAAVRTQFELASRDRAILLFGWDPYRKGVDLALAAMAEVVQQHPGAVLLLVGGPELERFVAEHLEGTIPPWLRIVHPVEEVADLFGAADFFLAPSREEGFSYGLAEAMANALPAAASTVSGHEWCRLAGGVVTMSPGSAPATTHALDRMLALPTPATVEAGESNRHIVEDHFSIDIWTKQMMAVYGRILAGSRNR